MLQKMVLCTHKVNIHKHSWICWPKLEHHITFCACRFFYTLDPSVFNMPSPKAKVLLYHKATYIHMHCFHFWLSQTYQNLNLSTLGFLYISTLHAPKIRRITEFSYFKVIFQSTIMIHSSST